MESQSFKLYYLIIKEGDELEYKSPYYRFYRKKKQEISKI